VVGSANLDLKFLICRLNDVSIQTLHESFVVTVNPAEVHIALTKRHLVWIIMNNGFSPMVVSPRCWKQLSGPRDDVFSLKMVEGILFLGIPGVI
jgi:hypothetical protein